MPSTHQQSRCCQLLQAQGRDPWDGASNGIASVGLNISILYCEIRLKICEIYKGIIVDVNVSKFVFFQQSSRFEGQPACVDEEGAQ